jgi:hypothetical protein
MKRVNWQVSLGRTAAVVGLLLAALTSSAMMPVGHAQNGAPCLLSGQTFWMNITQQTAIERAQSAIRARGLRVVDTQSFWVYGEGNQFSVFIFCPADDGSGTLTVPRATRVLMHVQVAGPPGSDVGSLRDFLGEHMRRGQNPGGTGSRDISGTWVQTTPGGGTSTWKISQNKDGTYSAEETGLGGAKGTATLTGDGRLRIDFKWSGGEGYYEWKLDATYTEGKEGRLVFTKGLSGTYPNSTVKRQQPPGGTSGGSSTPPASGLELAGDWRDNGGNEYRITKREGKYFGTYLKVNDHLKGFGFTVGEETLRNFTPVPGKANTFEGEGKFRYPDGNHFWQKQIITLNDDNNLTIPGSTYPQSVRIKR